MRRTAFAIAVAALIFASFSGVSHATLISPLPAGFVSEAVSGHLTQVWWRGGWRGYGWRGYGWRGYGWRGYGWRGYGWRGYGWRGYGWRGGWCRWHPYRCGW